jgi:peptide/nickel transport system ATP-binding protein
VVWRGDLVDLFDAADFDAGQRHPYTRSLLEAMPPPIHP